MLLTFKSGPDCLIDDTVTVSHIIHALDEPDGVTLVFNISGIGPGHNGVMIPIVEAHGVLSEILKRYRCPTYRAVFQPAGQATGDGRLRIRVDLKRAVRQESWVYDRPVQSTSFSPAQTMPGRPVMLKVFSGGPETINPAVVDEIAQALSDDRSIELCFSVPWEDWHRGRVAARLNWRLTAAHAPHYKPTVELVSLPPVDGRVAVWATLRRTEPSAVQGESC